MAATHALLVNDAVERIEKHPPSLGAVTNTVASGELAPSYQVASVADLLAEVITRLHQDG